MQRGSGRRWRGSPMVKEVLHGVADLVGLVGDGVTDMMRLVADGVADVVRLVADRVPDVARLVGDGGADMMAHEAPGVLEWPRVDGGVEVEVHAEPERDVATHAEVDVVMRIAG